MVASIKRIGKSLVYTDENGVSHICKNVTEIEAMTNHSFDAEDKTEGVEEHHVTVDIPEAA